MTEISKKLFKEVRHSELVTFLWMDQRRYEKSWQSVLVEIQDDVDRYGVWVGEIEGIEFIYEGPFQSYVNEEHLEKFNSLFDDDGNLIESNQ